MNCNHCVAAVTKHVRALPGVTNVEVDLATGELRVASERPLDGAAVGAAVADAGFEVT
jgi:copper chaperone CopZ